MRAICQVLLQKKMKSCGNVLLIQLRFWQFYFFSTYIGPILDVLHKIPVFRLTYL